MANIWQEQTSSSKELVKNFRLLLESSYGPQGGVKMIISAGGYLTVTSSSSRIIQNLPFYHPIINLILNCIKSQNNTNGDYGLYVGIISSFLIEKSWTHGNTKSIQKALKFVCDECLKLIEENSASVGMSSASNLLAIARSVLSSKPCCNMSNKDKDYLSVQIVKSFLSSVGPEAESQGLGPVLTMVHAGLDVQDSEVIDGLMYPYPEEDEMMLQLCTQKGPWKILIYTCMMNVPNSELQEANQLAFTSNLAHFNQMVSYFKMLLPKLTDSGIKLIACQKVMHPEVHLIMRRAGIVVIHRLGTKLAQGLQHLSGAEAIDAPCKTEWQKCVGFLDEVIPRRIHNKMFLQLKKREADVSTLVLCSPLPSGMEETEIVVRQALGSLAQIMMQPKILPGAGCFETWLAWRLKKDVSDSSIGNLKKGDVQAALSWVENALLNVPRLVTGAKSYYDLLQDSVTHHAWLKDSPACLCKSYWKEQLPSTAKWTELPLQNNTLVTESLSWNPTANSVVDIFKSKLSALQHAFDNAQAVLAIDLIVHC